MSRMLEPRPLVTALLLSAAASYLGYHLFLMASDPGDVGQYETVLAQATAGQIDLGAGRLYGPFDGSHPSVLMHAPLYYRLVGMLAWPACRMGWPSLEASLWAGRMLTLLAAAALIAATGCLAVSDGLPRRAAFYAGLLLAASPVMGVLASMVRPDALGVALATLGVLLVTRTLTRPGWSAARGLMPAYVAFALAACVKQHNLAAAATCSAFLLRACYRRELRIVPVVMAQLLGAAVGLSVLGCEEWATGGLMRHVVFELPSGPFREINYAGWGHVGVIFLDTAKRSIGLVALGLACGRVVPRRLVRLDAMLAVLLGAELLAMVPLCLFNQGAAANYAAQAVVFAAALVGRGIERALGSSGRVRGIPLILAALVLLAADLRQVRLLSTLRSEDRAALGAMLRAPGVAGIEAGQRYFVGNQALNRLHGRRSLIHDEWLYTAFEATEQAEPRQEWLGPALAEGPIRLVVVPLDDVKVPGLSATLPDLGYRRLERFGPYTVWRR